MVVGGRKVEWFKYSQEMVGERSFNNKLSWAIGVRQELRVCNYRGYEEEVEDEDGEGRRIELEGLQVRCKRRESEEDCFDRGVEGEEVPELFLGRAFWRLETGWVWLVVVVVVVAAVRVSWPRYVVGCRRWVILVVGLTMYSTELCTCVVFMPYRRSKLRSEMRMRMRMCMRMYCDVRWVLRRTVGMMVPVEGC